MLDEIIALCRNVDCNCVPWKVEGDRPVHLPEKVSVFPGGEPPYDIAVVDCLTDLPPVQPYGRIVVVTEPGRRMDYLPATPLQLINEAEVDGKLVMVFRPARQLASPKWNGEDGTILVYSDKGFGDDFHAARFPKALKRPGLRFVFEARAEEASFMREYSAYDDVCVKGEPLPPHDYHVEIGDLRCDKVVLPYFKRGEKLPGLNVGVVCDGHYVKLGSKRSIDPMVFANAPSEINFYWLQKPDHRKKQYHIPDRFIDVSGELHSWLDTARWVSKMTYIISVDTSIVHLAGGMGVDVKLIMKPEERAFYIDPYHHFSNEYGDYVMAHWGDPMDAVREILNEQLRMV